jgi:large conductance mechanosensitive channel
MADAKAKNTEKTKRQPVVRHEVVIALPTIKVPTVLTPFQGFINFMREQGVVGLAIGLVLGAQIKSLVDQMVASFINPLVGLLLPGKGSLAEKSFHLSLGFKGQDFLWGAFVAQLISFIAVAAIVYYVVKGLKLDKLDKKKDTK